jgi:hypothetical protein
MNRSRQKPGGFAGLALLVAFVALRGDAFLTG